MSGISPNNANSLHPPKDLFNPITKWKRHAVGNLPKLFSDKRDREHQDEQALQAELYRQIGQLRCLSM